jgi:hypothetical protein
MSPLATIALNAGLPIIEKVLSGKLGDAKGQLAAQVIRKVAEAAGAEPDALEAMADENPGRVIDAMRVVEKSSPEMLALYAADAQLQLAALAADRESVFAYAWRPGGMYLIGFLFLWNAVLLHIANAIWKIALPPMPWDTLLGVAGLYFSLYMGGHTLKDMVAKWTAQPGVQK